MQEKTKKVYFQIFYKTFLLSMDLFRNHSVITSIPLHYHPVLSQHLSNTQHTLRPTLYTRKIAPKCDFSCISANFSVPLQPTSN